MPLSSSPLRLLQQNPVTATPALLMHSTSPQIYIMRLRLGRTRQWIRNRSLRLLKIVLESGFASHAQFAHALVSTLAALLATFKLRWKNRQVGISGKRLSRV